MKSSKPHKKHPLNIAVRAACYSMLGALPLAQATTGGQVVGGSGTISQSGTNTTINQATQNLAINWQTFNVAANERVQFIQPNATSIALNRVLSNNGSTIAGRIDANGKVILVNPNGVFFTSTASLNVGSLIASGLDINPADFMNGQYIFNEIGGTSGKVVNSGLIHASLGGNVALIGKQVKNDGVITANLGTVTLAAGKQAVLTFDNAGLLGVRVSQEILQSELGVDPAVINSGDIQAQGGRVLLTASQSRDVFSRAVNTTGMEPATSVVVHDDGTFTLGGGADVLNSGSINTSTTGANQNAGRIVLIGENVTSSGTLKADAQSGNGGEIELHSRNMTLLTQNSLTSARSESNGKGGIVKVLGDKVGLFDQSKIDVSGANGGGQALIGGDFQGKNPAIRNASATIINPGASVYADALENGNGGKVIAWSDGSTYFLGNIYARGGSISGDGGLVETSGKEFLRFDGFADRTALNGASGLLLLDPKNITIQATGSNNGDLPNIAFNDPNDGSNSTISATVLRNNLNGGAVTLQANNDITFNEDVLATGTDGNRGNLTLQAGRSIILSDNVDISLNDRNFSATINHGNADNGSDTSGPYRTAGNAAFTMGAGSTIVTNGGDISIQTGNFSGNQIGNIVLQTVNSSVPGPVATAVVNGGSITITNTVGNIIANGAITATGENPANGNGGNGGAVLITANANAGTFTLNAAGSLTSNGGNAGTATDPNNDGGDGGPVTLSAANINIFGAISSNGGTGTGTGINGNGGNVDLTVGTDLTVAANISAVRGTNGTSGTNGDIIFNGNGNANIFNINNIITLAAASVTINGNGGIDRLMRGGTATTNVWTITSTNTGNLTFNGNTIHFNGMESLTGGILADSFILNSGSLEGLLDGGAGSADTLTLNSAVDIQLHGPAGALANQANRLNVAGVETITGVTGSPNIVYADNTANSWTIDATGTRIAPSTGPSAENTVTLVNFTQLNGGSGADTYALRTAYGGTINGGAGNDVFNINAGANITGNVNGDAGDDTFNINATGVTAASLIGGTGTDTLTAPDAANTWSVGTAGTGTLNTSIAFSQMESLVGALTQDDTFNFTVIPTNAQVSVDGRGHTTRDIVSFSAIAAGTAVNLTIGAADFNNIEQFTGNGTGTLTGADIANTWDITGTNSGTLNTTTTFNGFNNLIGGTNTDTFILGAAGSMAGTINGGTGGGNTLVGRDAANTWTVTGANAGTVADTATYATFTNIQSLTGALTQNDTFNFTVLPTTGLTVDGRGHTTGDTVSFATLTGQAVSVQLGAAGFNNIEQFTGNNTNSTLTGENNANTWTVTGTHAGSVDSIGFSGFTALVGGNDNDTFNFSVTPAVAGVTVNGSGHTTGDTVSFAGLNGTVSVQLGATGFSNIEQFTGNGANSTLIGENNANTWTVTGLQTGSVDGVGFSAFAALVGGSNDDTFNFSVPSTVAGVTVNGAGNTAAGDTVSFAGLTGTVSVQLGAAGFTNIERFTGNNTASTLIGENTINDWTLTGPNDGTVNSIAFVDFNNLTGGTNADTFNVNTAGQLSGLIDGGAGPGDNTLNMSSSTAATLVRLLDAAPVAPVTNPAGTLTVFQIGTLSGNSTANHTLTLNVSNPLTSAWNINAVNGGTVNFGPIASFAGFRNLTGSAFNDTFTLISNSVQELVTGVIDGGGQAVGGEDVLILTMMTDVAADVTVRLGTTPTAGQQLNVNGIERIVGNNTSTLIADNGTNNWRITGANDGTVQLNVGTTNDLVAFSDFAVLRGGDGNDNFQILSTNALDASIAGGGHVINTPGDTIDYSAQTTVVVNFGPDAFNGITEIESVRGNGRDSTLNGPAAGNANWSVTGINTGSVTDGPATMGFEGFNYLVGGSGNDTFTVTGGSLANVLSGAPGLIRGGGGTNTLSVALTGMETGQVSYLGTGTDTVTVLAGTTGTYNGAYTSGAAPADYDQLAYTSGTNSVYTVNYRDVDTVQTNRTLATLTVNGSANTETIALGTGTFAVGTRTPVNYTNVTNVTVNGEGGTDTVTLNNFTLVGGTLRLTAETVTGSGTLAAAALTLDNVGQFGTPTGLIATDLDTLNLINAGPVYLNETNGLNLNTTGTVNNAGIFRIAGTTTIDAGGGSLTLDNAENDFNNVNAGNAAALELRDRNRLDTGNLTANRIVLTTATGIGGPTGDGSSNGQFVTNTVNLTINNAAGGVYVTNNGSATVAITNQGDIGFTNNGNLIVDKLYTGGGSFLDRSQYRNVRLNVNGGSVQGIQGIPGRSVYDTPDITAYDLRVIVQGGGGLGNPVRPISISVVDTFSYLGGRGYIHYFGARPPNIFGANDLVTFSALDVLTGLQLLEVESLDEFDPAIFTEVRNYYYEDVAIMMPADQRLDGLDEEEKEEEKEGKL